jgi:hypothetical protein
MEAREGASFPKHIPRAFSRSIHFTHSAMPKKSNDRKVIKNLCSFCLPQPLLTRTQPIAIRNIESSTLNNPSYHFLVWPDWPTKSDEKGQIEIEGVVEQDGPWLPSARWASAAADRSILSC